MTILLLTDLLEVISLTAAPEVVHNPIRKSRGITPTSSLGDDATLYTTFIRIRQGIHITPENTMYTFNLDLSSSESMTAIGVNDSISEGMVSFNDSGEDMGYMFERLRMDR